MKRLTISYVLSGLLLYAAESTDTITANFADNKGTEPNKGTYSSVTNGTASANPQYGTDWYGSDSYLDLKNANLTFTFNGQAQAGTQTQVIPAGGSTSTNTKTKLLIKDGFNFRNYTKTDTAKVTLKWGDTKNREVKTGEGTLIFGTTAGDPSKNIKLGKGVNLTIDQSFKTLQVISGLDLAEATTLSASSSDLENTGGIVIGKDATIEAKQVKNDGDIYMLKSSTLKTQSLISSLTDSKRGKITVQGDATIEFSNGNSGGTGAKIESQDIKITNSVLTLKKSANRTNGGTITFGGDAGKGTSITGGEVKIQDFTKIESKDLSLKGVKLTAENATTLTNTKLSLQNAQIYLGGSGGSVVGVEVGGATSSFELTGKNNLISAGINGDQTLTVKGSHSFSGEGILTLKGKIIVFGDTDPAGLTLMTNNKAELKGPSSLIAQGEEIQTKNLTLDNITLQVKPNSTTQTTIKNTSLTLNDSVIEAIDGEDQLTHLQIDKVNGSSGTIKVSRGKSATLRGSQITLKDQNITLGDPTKAEGTTPTTLTLDAREGSITLDGTSFRVEGKDTEAKNNVLNLQSSQINLGKKVDFSKVNIFVGSQSVASSGVTFWTMQGGTVSFEGGELSTKIDDKYRSLSFNTQACENGCSSKLYFSDKVSLKASSISFSNQEITLGKNLQTGSVAGVTPAQNGNELSLYGYGTGVIGANGGSEAVGSFSFTNTKISANGNGGSSSGTTVGTLKLYGGGGVALITDGLTLDGVSIKALKIPVAKVTAQDAQAEEKTDLDLSASNGRLTTLATVNIEGKTIFIKRDGKKLQGIGMDVYIGDKTKGGQLTIKADEALTESPDTFVIGGDVVIDNSSNGSEGGGGGGSGGSGSNGTPSSLKIEIGSNGVGGRTGTTKKLDDQTLGLEIEGGLTAIGKENGGSSTPTEIKAKSFKFGEKSNLTSINGTLKLNTKEDTEIEIKGDTILQGTSTAEAKIEVTKTNGNAVSAPSTTEVGGQNSAVKLKLHDIKSTGKGSITNSGITFVSSHITAKALDGAKSLIITDQAAPTSTTPSPPLTAETFNLMEGSIASITLEGSELEFKRKAATGELNNLSTGGATETTASFKFDTKAFIKTSGEAKLTVESIHTMSEDEKDLYSLEVSSGSFTLIESKTKDGLGNITLKDGSFIFQKEAKTARNPSAQTPTYNTLKLQGDLTSSGDSSLHIDKLELKDRGEQLYKISSTDGELNFKLMGATEATLKNTITLNNGSLRLSNKDSQGAKLILKGSTITSMGNSAIRAGDLDLGGASIRAEGGRLTLQGVRTSTESSSVSIGDHGLLELRNSSSGLASLEIQKALTLSANVPYVSPSDRFGGGSFGRVNVKALKFESDGKSAPLIQIIVKQAAPNTATMLDDSLFALREGESVLVNTSDGITKKVGNAKYENITLGDVKVDKGGYSSLTLTPKLIMGETAAKKQIVKQLVLGVSVTQNTLPELLESIKDGGSKQTMSQFFGSALNVAIVEDILKSGNPLKAGMAHYISSGNVAVVGATLSQITQGFSQAASGVYASGIIADQLRMLRISSLENQMVRSGNPYVSKLQVAQILKSIAGNRYASSDDEILFDGVEEEGTNYGAVWANYEGATSFGTLSNVSVNGLSAGYDTLLGDLKEYLIGGYASYGYGSYGTPDSLHASHNLTLGFYSRMTFDRNEVDIELSQSFGGIKSVPTAALPQTYVAHMLKQNWYYYSFTTDAQVRYGYLIPVGEEESPFYFRPFGGVGFGITINTQSKGEGDLPIVVDPATHFKLALNFGLEMKKYFNEGSYIYLMPVLEKGLFNDGNVVNVGFANGSGIPYMQSYVVDTGIALYAGGQGQVAENISVMGGLGVKMNIESKDVMTNWNLGLKYRF